jgi:hypothetical protein
VNAFQETSDLLIGQVIEVSGTAIRVELDRKLSELSRVVDGEHRKNSLWETSSLRIRPNVAHAFRVGC